MQALSQGLAISVRSEKPTYISFVNVIENQCSPAFVKKQDSHCDQVLECVEASLLNAGHIHNVFN